VLHNDLKSGNILLDDHFRAKLSDFGLSQKSIVHGVAGTPYWMAPELFHGSEPSSATDVYSFGVTMFEIFSRCQPYEGQGTPQEVLAKVTNLSRVPDYRPRLPASTIAPQDLVDLMNECWNKNPLRRPTFEEIASRVGECLREEETHRRKSMQHMAAEGLLYQVFPKRIADALKAGKEVDPEHHDCVTVFFSDIVGFTNISSTLQPIKVMNMLDRLYKEFDLLARKHQVFKVETIGDAYMGVTNLIEKQEDHAQRMCCFAIEVVEAANRVPVEEGNMEDCVHIRVGLHCGSVVASVVGTLNPRFCLFGDTVNMASRMESNSAKDKIHMSETTTIALIEQGANSFLRWSSRGEIDIKGKGRIKTFWLESYSGINMASIKADVDTPESPIWNHLNVNNLLDEYAH